MTKEERREYERSYRANVENQTCECGAQAVKRTGGGFICARCLELEASYRNIVDPRLRNPPERKDLPKNDNSALLLAEVRLTDGRGWGSLELLEARLREVNERWQLHHV